MLKTKDLNFSFPPELVSTFPRPRGDSRIFKIPRDQMGGRSKTPSEISWAEMFDLFSPGDVLVLNDSKVVKARLRFGQKEVLFLKSSNGLGQWEVMTRGLKPKIGKKILLPEDVTAEFLSSGKICQLKILNPSRFSTLPMLFDYFEKWGEVPLPPYILALRNKSDETTRAIPEAGLSDSERYQTVWAKDQGSVAAPTASLHFNSENLEELKRRGVELAFVTLHVGAGTFLPIETENIDDFHIHSEWISVSEEVVLKLNRAKKNKNKIWTCGTTALRAIESHPLQSYTGQTQLFIRPGFKFEVADGLLTNFHQPESSLLLLVAAFRSSPETSEGESVRKLIDAYQIAIENKFRLFSYGDLTVLV